MDGWGMSGSEICSIDSIHKIKNNLVTIIEVSIQIFLPIVILKMCDHSLGHQCKFVLGSKKFYRISPLKSEVKIML
jgi:hypothetical protein